MLYIWSDKEVCHASQTRINTGFAEFCSWLLVDSKEVRNSFLDTVGVLCYTLTGKSKNMHGRHT